MTRHHHTFVLPPNRTFLHGTMFALQQPAACMLPACAAAKPARRRLLLSLPLAGVAVLYSERALAYGGSGNIRSTDSGSGNPRYEDLIADIQKRGGDKLSITVERPDSTAPPLKGKCLTGREKACK
jgi:hypothetical protein